MQEFANIFECHTAMDRDGQRFAYSEKPALATNAWIGDNFDRMPIMHLAESFNGDWKDSLCCPHVTCPFCGEVINVEQEGIL